VLFRSEMHRPDADPLQGPVTLGPDDALEAPDILPGFSLPLSELFSE